MLADEDRADAQTNAGDDDRAPGESAPPNGGLVDEVRTALEEHDRRSETMSPDPATREQAQRRRDPEDAAREEARRLREGTGPDDER